jgi:hypothetical protein
VWSEVKFGIPWIMLKTSVGSLVLLGAMAASAQDPIPGPPPPPPAVTPQRIRVGGQVQAARIVRGPGREWTSVRLTAQQLAECELKVQADPNDVRCRGRLIAALPYLEPQFQRNVQGFSRVDHLFWMIQHQPDWDGFLLEPHNGLSEQLSEEERARVKFAWLDQVNLRSERATVLHSAAMFFAIREPERASALLEQAIAIEPKELLHVERLGMVYAYALLDRSDLSFRFVSTPERTAFVQQAQDALARSDSWILLRGAAGILLRQIGRKGGSHLASTLAKELLARADALSTERELPSESPRFRREPR